MSQVLERQRSEYRVPVRHRSPMVDHTLVGIGALVALVGAYFQFAPSDWWLAHLSEAYHLGAYTLGGLILGTGFGVYADRTAEADDRWSARAITAVVLAAIAIGGAVVAGLLLAF